MGFFGLDEPTKKKGAVSTRAISTETLHKGECSLCPLNKVDYCRHPKMEPSGHQKPVIYLLGSGPTPADDRADEHFQGEVGSFLRLRTPRKAYEDYQFRFNHIIRTMRPDDEEPERTEVECCRPSIVRDIEATKPFAIFGLGKPVLDWALGPSWGGAELWSGRHVPIKVGNHTCWFFPFSDPTKLIEGRRWEPRGKDDYTNDAEFAFKLHWERALKLVDTLPEPRVHTKEEAHGNITLVTGANGKADLRIVLDYLKEAAERRGLYGMDYETNRLRPYSEGAKILTAALSGKNGTLAWAMDHPGAKWSKEHRKIIDKAYEDFLYDAEVEKISFNLFFEQEWSAVFYGKEVLHAQKWHDAMAQAWTLDEREGGLSLEFLGMQHFGINLKEIADVNRKSLEDEPVEKVLLYNGADAKYHRLLFLKQRKALEEDGTMKVYNHTVRRIQIGRAHV